MIMFEYSCNECGKIYEVYQNINEDKIKDMYCPECGKITQITRLIGSSGFVLLGDGWEIDSYQKDTK